MSIGIKSMFLGVILGLVSCSKSEFKDMMPVSAEKSEDIEIFSKSKTIKQPQSEKRIMPWFINDKCTIFLKQVKSVATGKWTWSLIYNDFTGNISEQNCLYTDPLQDSDVLAFLRKNLSNFKYGNKDEISTFAIDVFIVESLAASSSEVTRELAKQNPNRPIRYNETDGEFLRPAMQEMLNQSSFIKQVCNAFFEFELKCDGRFNQTYVFRDDFKTLNDIVDKSDAGLGNWSKAYLSFQSTRN